MDTFPWDLQEVCLVDPNSSLSTGPQSLVHCGRNLTSGLQASYSTEPVERVYYSKWWPMKENPELRNFRPTSCIVVTWFQALIFSRQFPEVWRE